MYKPNFDTGLKFKKAFSILNELANHIKSYDIQPDDVIYFICSVNEKTKQLLCNLGVDITKLAYYDENDGVDIAEIYLDIAYHYDHKIYFNGETFIVKDKEKEELLEAVKGFLNACDYGDRRQASDSREKIEEIIQKVEGDFND